MRSGPTGGTVVSLFNLDSGAVEEPRFPLWGRHFRVPEGTVLPPDNIRVMLTEP